MLRIAVCDDMAIELARIVALTNAYLAERFIPADVRAFSHPDALATALENESFHIFLLDIVMPMTDGLALGRSARRLNADAQMIFITTDPSFALDAYSVHPLDYLLKPVNKQALFAALDLATEKLGRGEGLTVTVKTRAGLRSFSKDAILFCEYARHAAVYALVGGERVETATLPLSFKEHIAPILRDKRFIKPHAAFVVNMRYVERLNKDGFTLRGGAFVPISGKQYAAVRDAYMRYRLGEE